MLIFVFFQYGQHQAQFLQLVIQMYKKKQFLPQRVSILASEKVPASSHCQRGKQGEEGEHVVVLTDLVATQESLSSRRKHLASCRIRPLQVVAQRTRCLFHQVMNVF